MRLLGRAHGAWLHAMAARPGRPAGGRRARREVRSPSRTPSTSTCTDRCPGADRGDRLADRCVQRLRGAGRSGRTVVIKVRRLRLLHAHPLRDAARPHGRPRPSCGRPPRGCWRRSTPPAACGCWGWASAGSPTSRRRTSSPRPPASARRAAGAAATPAPERSGASAAGAEQPEPHAPVAARAGRRPPRVRRGMGAGQRGRPGDGPVRAARLSAGPGAHLRRGRPGAERVRPPAAGRPGVIRPFRRSCRSPRPAPEGPPPRTRPARSGGRAAAPARGRGGGPPRSPGAP